MPSFMLFLGWFGIHSSPTLLDVARGKQLLGSPAHVREVQTLLARWKYDANAPVNDRATRPKVYGGCQLFLDLTGAFDAMPREHLRDAFQTSSAS